MRVEGVDHLTHVVKGVGVGDGVVPDRKSNEQYKLE